jgi:hypothetical protein
MITRPDILLLGLNAAVIGALTGGLLFGLGLGLVVNHQYAGWLLMLPAAPVAGGIGLLLARRAAKKLAE